MPINLLTYPPPPSGKDKEHKLTVLLNYATVYMHEGRSHSK